MLKRPRLRLLPRSFLPTCLAVALGAPVAAQAQQADSAAAARARWQSSLAAFEAADKLARPSDGGVLFVGSSTIRLWDRLAEDFSQVPAVINRGFGGSTMEDWGHFARQLVVAYRPRHVLVYAGDNDLAEGRSPAQVLESFQAFVRTVRAELPDTRIDYISIKPSPLRAALLPRAREANALLAGYVATLPNAGYIDVFTPMLDGTGAPRADLYGPDRLHMNAAGYALWRAVIAARVTTPPAPLESPPSPALATRAAPASPR